MGTRSTISMRNADYTVTSIYCHWDGYIRHHGPILLNHYNTLAKVKALIGLRSLSTLGHIIGEKHHFDERFTTDIKPCTSHYRDRGERIKAYVGPLEGIDWQEYNYLFEDGKWKVCEDGVVWKDLSLEVVTDRLTA